MRCAAECSGNPDCAIACGASAVGSGDRVAKIIEYYVPESFRKKAGWIPPDQRGKVIQFPVPEKKSG